MKNITKCYLYFGSVLVFCLLNLVNYFMTHNNDGFERLKSQFGLDLKPFYCYKEDHYYRACERSD